jgi:hypothetical protein
MDGGGSDLNNNPHLRGEWQRGEKRDHADVFEMGPDERKAQKLASVAQLLDKATEDMWGEEEKPVMHATTQYRYPREQPEDFGGNPYDVIHTYDTHRSVMTEAGTGTSSDARENHQIHFSNMLLPNTRYIQWLFDNLNRLPGRDHTPGPRGVPQWRDTSRENQ